MADNIEDELWEIVRFSKTGHVTVNKVLRWYKENVDSKAKVCTSCGYEVKFLYSRVSEILKKDYNYGEQEEQSKSKPKQSKKSKQSKPKQSKKKTNKRGSSKSST